MKVNVGPSLPTPSSPLSSVGALRVDDAVSLLVKAHDVRDCTVAVHFVRTVVIRLVLGTKVVVVEDTMVAPASTYRLPISTRR